ncbi:MAG: UTP--glucose-1-phosphate uridylyltransferase [Myxococcales bacterium]|nr:UTP--glucose-1-phosphate uridylyltransferase [Myxococcales bacterium]
MGQVKGVILAAGYGTRFLPVTRVVPKELLPIGTRPALDWVVREMAEAGIEEILVITSRRKRGIEDWFDTDVELEGRVGRARLGIPNVRATFVRQHEMKGTGHALLMAREFAGIDPVVVAFPDDLFGEPNCSARLIATWERTGCSVLACGDLSGQDVSRYGVVDAVVQGDVLRVRGVVEKPAPGTEPSHLVSWGRYLYTPQMFSELAAGLSEHTGGEFYATDAINTLASQGKVVADVVPSPRYDTGQPLGYLTTVVRMGMQDPEVGPAFRAWLSRQVTGAE